MAGTCYIKVDGEQIAIEGSVEFPLSTTVRETKIGSTGVVGYSETERAPFIKLSAWLGRDFPVDAITTGDDMTITAELANGWVYTLEGAFLVGEIDGNASDGTTSLEFNGRNGFLQTN